MDVNRCATIIANNKKMKDEIEYYLEIFYSRIELKFGEQLSFDSLGMIQSIAEKLRSLSVCIPMNDSEVGALCYYHKNACSYLFLNSAIPEANMRYAFCHDMYHLLKPNEAMINNGLDMYLDAEYKDNEDELKANSFAGAILMPEAKTKDMYRKIYMESNDIKETIVKLTDCFGAPYVAVIIRCYELGLIIDKNKLKDLLSVTRDDLLSLYEKYWLNSNLLEPKKTDQFKNLKRYLIDKSNKYVKSGDLTYKDQEYILDNITRLYDKIRVKTNDNIPISTE